MSSLALPEPAITNSAAARRAHRHFLDGRVHASNERWPRAVKAYERAADLLHDSAYALAAAHAAIKAGRPRDAIRRLRRLRREHPELTLGYTLESHAWLELSCPGEAVAVLQSLPAEAARDHAFHVALAVGLQKLQRHEAAVQSFMAALAQKLDDAPSHFRLGMSFKELGLKAEAAECVRTALVLGLGSSELSARALLVFLEREACRWGEAEPELAMLRAAVQTATAGTAVETGAFVHAVLVDDPAEQLKVATFYANHLASRVVPLPRQQARGHAGRLRIGYFSADFHQHATSQLAVQVFEAHDRERFEVTLFSAGPDDGTPLRRRMEAASEHFVELHGQSMAQMATAIRARRVDVLVDMKGATYGSVMPVMAYRPAPLQVYWLGFPGTSGASYIDYLIGDPVLTPIGHAPHFSEKIAQLPLCYQPNDNRRPAPAAQSRSALGLSDDALVLCGFHQSYKISRQVFATWCRLLRALPDAVLWLLRWNANVESSLLAAAAAEGIPAARLVFAPLLPAEPHLARLAAADLFLDAWPCNAHTTASEALWMGVPPVTMIGQTFAQRVAASLLHASGLPELVCHDSAHYEQTVLQLAVDFARRRRLRDTLLAQRSSHPLFDGVRFARDIEALFERMWARAIAGLPPAHLPAES
ncbi:MAG: tetratricopeptide repeat protein [Burkholderiaceae bacterium]|nr:tetratricopeptide repeat protein [Burkholderiaceae bacterium]